MSATVEENKVNPSIRLKRFIYLTEENQRFISGNPETHNQFLRKKVPCVDEFLVGENWETLFTIIEIANADNNLPNRETLFFVLALAASTSIPIKANIRQKIYEMVLRISKDDKDFFKFIKHTSILNKTFSSGINKLIGAYYTKKDPKKFAEDIGFIHGYHGWTHKDLIKLSHVKPENILHTVLIKYLLFGIDKAQAAANENVEACQLLEYLKKTQDLKKCNEEEKGLELLKQFPSYGFQQLPTPLNKAANIWLVLLDNMSMSEILNFLPRLYKSGHLSDLNPCLIKINEKLTNIDIVKASLIHPVEVFIALRNFEKGGKPMDPKLLVYLEAASVDKLKKNPQYEKKNFSHVEPFKCPTLISALNKALLYSYGNLQPAGIKYFITIDVNDTMNSPCITTKNVTCLEAAVIITLCLLKEGNACKIAVFNGTSLNPVVLKKAGSVSESIKTLREAAHGRVNTTAPFQWAKSKNTIINCFVNITYCPEKNFSNTADKLEKYKKVMNVSNVKLVHYVMGTSGLDVTPEYESILDIRGFDKNVPKILNAFVKSSF